MRTILRRMSLLIAAMLLLPVLAPAATKTAKFNVTATVQSDCTIAATNLAFGTVGLVAGNVDAILRASSMMFQLYRDSARTQVWGETSGVNTVGNTGNGAPMEITVYGRIPPQTSPTVGAYIAQITATITY